MIGKFRRGETTYVCHCCKKLTRNTGDEGGAGLCADCYDLAGIQNGMSDNGPDWLAEEAANGKGPGMVARAILTRRPELVPLFKDVADIALNPMF
jgi:hypothetical protein